MSHSLGPVNGEIGRMRAGRVLGTRYRLVEPLASGAAGDVWRAVQVQLGREVAVKTLRTDLSAEARAQFEPRFMREAALAGRLQHPNVVTFHDYGVDADGTPFVVMELLRGRTLREACELRAMPAAEAARIVEAVARGLRHAHGQGMIHRDIKPSNIFLVRDEDGTEVPKLVDFGLVKGDEVEVTAAGTFLGTPAYMPPEQARGGAVTDPRADVYSLGVVFYRILSGVMPFAADNAVALAVKHMRDPYPPIADRAGLVVDPTLEDIIRACLAKEPEQRPTAAELVDRLRGWRGELSSSGTVWPKANLPDEPGLAPAVVSSGWLALGGAGLVGGLALACAGLGVAGLSLGWVWGTGAAPPPTVHVALGEVGIHEVDPAPSPEVSPLPPPPPPPPPASAMPPVPVAPRAAPEREKPAPKPVAPPPTRAAPPPAPPPAPTSTSAPPAAPPGGGLWIDGVAFQDAAHVQRALKWLNTAEYQPMVDAGVYGKGISIIQRGRPWASVEAFAATPGVGEKTVLAAARASAAP